jgi:nucleoside-diphosphate-sugar epimerase
VKALVTGATGFLGGALTRRLLADGVSVRTFVRPGRQPAVPTDDVWVGDLRDARALRGAVEGVDVVFHAGARVSTTGSWEEFEATNVRATEELVRLATQSGVRRVVHVSSLSVYGVPHDGAVVSEDSPYETGGAERGFYARSKLAADQVASNAIASGAPVVIVRPGLLYGPGRRPPLGRRTVALGSLRVILARRDYLLPLAYVENVVDALCLAARADAAAGRAYTIVDTHARQDEYARLYREVAGERWRAVFPPLAPILAAATVGERLFRLAGRRAPISRHQIERTIWSATFAVTRAQRELGWTPRVPLAEALRRSFVASDPMLPGGAPAAAQSAA